YEPGILTLEGSWNYVKQDDEIVINLNQVQTDGSLFEMPIEVKIDYANGEEQIKLIQITSSETNVRLKVESEPVQIHLDPHYWVLMNASFKKLE
ncbi:hypothetical protein OAT82_02610, partial [Flavobacteriaceae bacterium]|nr:hypothetical protein [Flavobacteriaceae bacterium]